MTDSGGWPCGMQNSCQRIYLPFPVAGCRNFDTLRRRFRQQLRRFSQVDPRAVLSGRQGLRRLGSKNALAPGYRTCSRSGRNLLGSGWRGGLFLVRIRWLFGHPGGRVRRLAAAAAECTGRLGGRKKCTGRQLCRRFFSGRAVGGQPLHPYGGGAEAGSGLPPLSADARAGPRKCLGSKCGWRNRDMARRQRRRRKTTRRR